MKHVLPEEAEELKRQEEEKKRKRKELLFNFHKTFSSEHGRFIYRYILAECHLFESTFTGNSRTFYNEGRRSVALDLLTLNDDANTEDFEQLIREEREVRNE
jgi:hypothetical protein